MGACTCLPAPMRRRWLRLTQSERETLLFPPFSCGVYGWDPVNAAPIAMRAVRESLLQAPCVRAVTFVLFNDDAFDAFRQALDGG